MEGEADRELLLRVISRAAVCKMKTESPVHREMEAQEPHKGALLASRDLVSGSGKAISLLPASASPVVSFAFLLPHLLVAHRSWVNMKMQNDNAMLQRQSLYAVSSHMGLARSSYLIFTLSYSLWGPGEHIWHGVPDSFTYEPRAEEHGSLGPSFPFTVLSSTILSVTDGKFGQSRARHPCMVQIAEHLNTTAVSIPRPARGWWHSTCSGQAVQWRI